MRKVSALIRIVGCICLITWPVIPAAQTKSPRRTVVVVMDNPLIPYDAENQSSGRSNTDEIKDGLKGISRLKVLEVETNWEWKGEQRIKSKRPDLIIIHLSAFTGSRGTGDDEASYRLLRFFQYMSDTNAKFLIYTRAPFFKETADQQPWIKQMERRVPALKDRIRFFQFDEDKGFRDPLVRRRLKEEVRNMLGTF
jgi:hypothetical protein